MVSGRPVSEAQWELFLAVYAACGVITQACRAADIDRGTYYLRLHRDPEFEARMREAHEEAKDVVLSELNRRGIEGWDEPVFQKGKQVGVVRRYSDAILLALARARLPEMFTERHVVAQMQVSPADVLAEGRRRLELVSGAQPADEPAISGETQDAESG